MDDATKVAAQSISRRLKELLREAEEAGLEIVVFDVDGGECGRGAHVRVTAEDVEVRGWW